MDSSYSYHACRGHVGPCVQCPISGESRETRTGLQPYEKNLRKFKFFFVAMWFFLQKLNSDWTSFCLFPDPSQTGMSNC